MEQSKRGLPPGQDVLPGAAVEARNAEIEALKAKNDALEKWLEAFERLLPRETAQATATRGPGE